jgi:hypothetical protein
MEFWRTAAYVVWTLVGIMSIGMTVIGGLWYRKWFKKMFEWDKD